MSLALSDEVLEQVISLLLPGVEEGFADIGVLLLCLLQVNMLSVAIVCMLKVNSESWIEHGELCDAVSHARTLLN